MSVQRYKQNPFLEGMMVPIKGKNVRLSRLGKDDNVLINNQTGEVLGTHVTTTRTVDSEQFVKIFSANIGLAFDLTAAGIKAFTVLLWAVQKQALSKDEVTLDTITLEDFLDNNSERKLKLSIATFRRGISELEAARIVAKTLRKGRYFINPNFVFSGDRVAFTNIIKRRIQDADPNQPDMFADPPRLEKS